MAAKILFHVSHEFISGDTSAVSVKIYAVGTVHFLNSFWKWLWKAKIHERLKFFMWKISVGILPTCDKIGRFLPLINPFCMLCGGAPESVEHLFLSCPFSRSVWWGSKWAFRLDHFQNWNIIQWMNLILDRGNPAFDSIAQNLEFTTYAAVIMDLTWKNRNKVLHGEEIDSVESIIAKTDSKVREMLPSQISKFKDANQRHDLHIIKV
ncbi:hypothetical protein BUALT_Bualt02G0140600 [Buddleja alternifolia]|uniref:Reverse transcriptase zinc-binding domain-containing protein n=1 Tax=Buddleja alternifolia TaxID=168488 RepID=A0AAV6YAS5_9LAMI|nr:hypothetical protein BUALT_Bualt02G0140600 [Buddleja alternifolia]